MRHLAKRALSLLLALLLCLTLFPITALAEEGSISPVEDGEDGGLSGTPAPTEEEEPGYPVGDGVLDVPSDDPAASAPEPAADELQGIVASGTCGDNMTWTLDDAGLLTISGEGDMTDWLYDGSPWYSQRESIISVLIENGVTSIGNGAFCECSNLTSVTIPVGVTGIGDWAFFRCDSLTSVALPVGVTSIGWQAFSFCSSLTSVTIPDSVTSIGEYAFESCSSLMSVTIPAGVTSIGGEAFSNCSSLQEILVAKGNKAYASVDGVLYDASLQTLIQCPGGKTGELTIPTGVTRIAGWSFQGCTSLTCVTIPASVISIGRFPFAYCGSLQEILVVEGNKAYASVDGVLYDAGIQTLLQCPGGKTGAITIPAGVTCIGDCAFRGCSSLTSVSIPKSVTNIERDAFYGCSSLTGMTIPAGVTSIGDEAFEGCSSLKSVTIPQNITSIGYYAFSGCSSLTTVLFQGNAPMIERGAFGYDRATAVYPIDNPTWTSDKLQDYGGTLTWVGYRDQAAAYTIHFDPNGGSSAPEDQIKGHNVDITLTQAVPSRENAAFLGWSTRRGAAQPDYLPGDSFGRNADTTLYAVWKMEAPILPTEAALTLGSAKVCAGQEFTMELTMENNPGLMYLSFRLDYDGDSLEFLGAEDGLFTGWTVNKEKNFLAWDADRDRTDNGTLLRLRFLAKEEARTGETAIALGDLFATNYAEELLGIGSVPGTVTILPHTPGDVTGDGTVDGRDLVRLRKYLAGVPDTEIIEANANVNGDDKIDLLDLIRLRKYLAQEDVILE